MYFTQDQIDRANQTDLVSFLQSQGEQLTRAGQEYRWKRHDSLTLRGTKWYRHSQSRGGNPIDFVMEFYGRSFTEAVQMLTGEQGAGRPEQTSPPSPAPDFRLPPRNNDNCTARNYLTAARRIDEDVTGFFFDSGDIYEEASHRNAVFVGRDLDGIPRYAHQRGTAERFRLDVKGSDKAFNFCYRGEGERLFAFEAPIDLLSFLCLFKRDWKRQSYLSLGGVGERALLRFLSDSPNIKTVYLCLDSDRAGSEACNRLNALIPDTYSVNRLVPLFKDWNEVLQRREEVTDGKYLREAVYGLRQPPQEETVEIIRMSDVDTQTVEWLWEPYIPFGKVTIVQGNPGEGKTTLADVYKRQVLDHEQPSKAAEIRPQQKYPCHRRIRLRQDALFREAKPNADAQFIHCHRPEWIAIIRIESFLLSRKEVTSHEETAGKGENHSSL